MKEAIYYSNILGLLIVSLSGSGKIFLQNDEKWTGASVSKEIASRYILNSEYELIGYV